MLVLARSPEDLDVTFDHFENVEFAKTNYRVRDLLGVVNPDDLIVVPAYLLQSASITDQLRLARHLVRTDVAVVAGPNRLTVARNEAPHRMERLIGPGSVQP